MKLLKKLFIKNTSSQDLSLLAFSQTPVATVLTDLEGTILNINHSFTSLTGYTPSDIKGHKMSLLKSGEYNNAFYKSFYTKLNSSKTHALEIYNRCKNDQVLLMKEKIVHIQSNGAHYYIVTLEDITEQKKQSDRFQHLAMHDMLTGLPNRTLLRDRFSHARLNATRNGKKLAILMCDLNEFKEINDTYGHNAGDVTLKSIAEKLEESLRTSDTIARYGGDEFVIILEQINNMDEVSNIINTLNSSFPLTIDTADGTFEVCLSIGYSLFPNNGTTFDQLLNSADDKMYKEKERYYGLT